MTGEDIQRIKNIVKETIQEESANESKTDVEDEKSARYAISKLGPKSDNIMIINKINEIINEFNKSLIDNRI